MRVTLSLLFCFALICSSESKPLHGYIVFSDGRIEKVIFDIPFLPAKKRPDYLKIQSRVKYQYNFRDHKLRPEEANGFIFFNESDTVRMLNIPFGTSGASFAKVNIDGPLTLYDYYVQQDSRPHYILQVGVDFVPVNRHDYSALMIRLLSGCMAEGVASEKEEIESDLVAFITWYNENCASVPADEN